MPATAPASPDPQLPAHVLVVEDDAVLAMTMQDALEDAGIAEVELCTSTDNALEALKRARPDAVVLDVHLADRKDGWAIAEILRTLGGAPRIVFSTGSPTEIPEDIAALGPILVKPYAMNELVDALREEPRQSLLSRLRDKLR